MIAGSRLAISLGLAVGVLAAAAFTTAACTARPRAAEPAQAPAAPASLDLASGWQLQSSAAITAAGEAISQPGFDASRWYQITVPNTVVGALVQNGTYKDPFEGTNIRDLPAMKDALGKRYSLVDTPADNPFKPSWWYRTDVDVPASLAGQSLALHFDGINYRANIWVNGRRIANDREAVGVFRRFEFDVTPLVKPGARTAIAVQVFGPEPRDLGIMWVDWNPTPPDKNMGLWGAVRLTHSGPVALRHPNVVPNLDVETLKSADLTVTTEVWNTTDRQVRATVTGTIETVRFSKDVTLEPRARAIVRFTPGEIAGLTIPNPRVWCPYRMGTPELYTLDLTASIDGAVSDTTKTSFGIRHVTSELTKDGNRLFKINGKPILIRGGGWASDMLLRDASPERLAAELRYVKEMGLNTIRLEGKLETEEFYELADREGILLMPGWCCCDQWEMWDKWDEEDHRVAPASLLDQAKRLRNHPSVFVWLNGSDNPPPPDVERAYLDALKEAEWNRPVLSSATNKPSAVTGPSGVKMLGPYDYVPPNYWLTDTKNGGAFGFATEISPGAAVPPIESLRRMVPPNRLWPINDDWLLHSGGDEFRDLDPFTNALEGRYGKATSAEDYARKAQALTYESERAMFEGYGRNKYRSTGVIQWMLNNAWPSMIWHLYDYYLRPGGGYFGTKTALEPLHVQYSYDDRSIAIVNDLQQAFPGVRVSAEVLDLQLSRRFFREATLDVGPDAVARPFAIPSIQGLSGVYFLRLSARDANGRQLSRNFYWLSTRDDVLDWSKATWFMTPTLEHSDLSAVTRLPKTTVTAAMRAETARDVGAGTPGAAGSSTSSTLPSPFSVTSPSGPVGEGHAIVTVTNTGGALAFQVRLKLVSTVDGQEVLPVFWDDNYIELMPKETREIRVTYPRTLTAPRVEVEGWNVGS